MRLSKAPSLQCAQEGRTLYRKGVMSIQVTVAWTYALLARKMHPAAPHHLSCCAKVFAFSLAHCPVRHKVRLCTCPEIEHSQGQNCPQMGSMDRQWHRVSPVKVLRIHRHQQTSSKMWSQMRPPLSKQRSDTYRMLYRQNVLQGNPTPSP